jgi:RNA polymerase sigma-70 factor (ECF subfamily)
VIATNEAAGPPATDAAVIEQSWAAPERFEAIFRRYFGQVHRYLAARVGGRIADDLAAEVFTIAFAQRQRYDLARVCARPWLYGIATNLAGSFRRRERRRYRALARIDARGVAPSDEDLVAERVSAAAAGPALAAALAGLGSGDRDVLLLVAVAGLDNQEVALALGIPYGTVCSRLSRARARLREALGGTNPASSYVPADTMRPAGAQADITRPTGGRAEVMRPAGGRKEQPNG